MQNEKEFDRESRQEREKIKRDIEIGMKDDERGQGEERRADRLPPTFTSKTTAWPFDQSPHAHTALR